MRVRNKKNGSNTLIYKVGGMSKSELISSGVVVDLADLKNFNQVVNKQDFKRGWFEFIEVKEEVKIINNALDKAKKQAEEYSEETKNKK